MFVKYSSVMSEPFSIEHRELRSAIEFAVLVAEEANKGKASLPFPKELRAQFGAKRIPTGSLGRLRRAIEADAVFRERIAAGAVPELVDPIGMLWLQRPAGWESDIAALVDARQAEASDADLRTAVRREEKRRRAAEQATARSRAELIQQQTAIDTLRSELDLVRADLVKADDAVAELRADLIDVRNEARHARDREAAATARLVAFERETNAGYATGSGEARDDLEPSGDHRNGVDPGEIAEVAVAARKLVGRLEALLPAEPADARPRPVGRQPLRLPGGVIASSAAAAEFLLRSDAVVLVDGYNVAMLAWSNRPLETQRTRLLDGLENLARRFGSDITAVFDGAAVVGAHTARRRLVRVVYSPDGVIADDVIRDEVRRLPAARAVAVVTNDREIVGDVRALGANIVPSNALLALL